MSGTEIDDGPARPSLASPSSMTRSSRCLRQIKCFSPLFPHCTDCSLRVHVYQQSAPPATKRGYTCTSPRFGHDSRFEWLARPDAGDLRADEVRGYAISGTAVAEVLVLVYRRYWYRCIGGCVMSGTGIAEGVCTRIAECVRYYY
eukprot:1413856-Rhodomonas_salina.1